MQNRYNIKTNTLQKRGITDQDSEYQAQENSHKKPLCDTKQFFLPHLNTLTFLKFTELDYQLHHLLW